MENDNKSKDLDDKKWNGEHFEQHREFNEGFSAENLPTDYNPSQMKHETETDEQGNTTNVDRARFTEIADESQKSQGNEPTDNSAIENKDSLQNRDRNYDSTANRYPPAHPDNHTNRGNIKMDED